VAPHANALVMVNCISAAVMNAEERPLFDGQKRGIAGESIRQAALDQVRLLARIIRQHNLKLRIVGVGGIATAQHVRAHLEAGSEAVQLATAAMLEPLLGLNLRRALSNSRPLSSANTGVPPSP
jgi:dihydroorotate dehydrogenase